MKRNPQSWREVFQQSPEAVARWEEKCDEAADNMERDGIKHILDGGGKFGRKVASAPPPKALRPRSGIVNIRRAGR